MIYDFDEYINRVGTNCVKFDGMGKIHGKDVMELGVADMDFRSPQPILEAMRNVVDKGVFGYTDLPDNYSTLVKGWMKRRYGCEVEENWVVFSPRINMAMNMAVETFTNEGDGIILHTPAYGALQAAILKNNRKLIESPLQIKDGRYRMDFEELEKKMDSSVKMLLFCSPHNPTCRVWSKEELDELAAFCEKHQLIVVSDEIHADILAKEQKHISLIQLAERFSQRVILCSSITKTFNLPGIILANMIIPNEVMRDKIKSTIDRWGLHNPNIFAAAVLEAAYTECDDWLEQVNKYIRGNYQIVKTCLETYIPELKILPSEGTYVAWISYQDTKMTEKEIESFFIDEAKVGVYMGSQFGEAGKGYIRLNLATTREYLKEALGRVVDKADKLKCG